MPIRGSWLEAPPAQQIGSAAWQIGFAARQIGFAARQIASAARQIGSAIWVSGLQSAEVQPRRRRADIRSSLATLLSGTFAFR